MAKLTPMRAIALHCYQCSGDSYKERELCQIPDCPLYPYRLGKTGRKGRGNPEGTKALAEWRRKKALSNGLGKSTSGDV
jgi:hypothetical protein